MAGGFLKGAILGGVLSVAGASVISVLVPLPSPPDVADVAPETELQISVVETSDLAETPSITDSAPETTDVAQAVEAPEPDPVPAVEETVTRAAVPVPGEAVELDAPEVVTAELIPTPDAEAPVLPTPQALAPMLPEPTDAVTVETAPAAAPLPLDTAPETEVAAADDPEDTTLPASETTAQAEAPQPLPETEAETVVVEPAPAEAPVTEEVVIAEAEPTPANEEVDVQLPRQEEAPTETQVADNSEAVDEDAQTVVASIQIGTAAERLQSSETFGVNRVQIGKPGVSLVDRNARIKINRASSLPTITTSAEGQAGDSVQSAPAGLLDTPIHANAQPFENEDGRPLMSIVLIDEGDSLEGAELGFSALSSFPYPLSIAVKSSLPDADARMKKYRENGFEVLAMIDLPEGAAPTDAEVTLGVTLDRMDDVVAVLEGTGSGLQASRDVSDQVAEILLQSGHGLVSQSQGLNTAPKLARKAGVPARPVFRDFDGKGQDARVIRRFLDQAAFKARQEGGVIMQGRLRPETIKALLVWGLAERASQVALAPVSAVLLTQ